LEKRYLTKRSDCLERSDRT